MAKPNMSPVKNPIPEQDPNVRNKNFLEASLGYDEAIERSSMYKPFERHKHEETCNLFAKEAK